MIREQSYFEFTLLTFHLTDRQSCSCATNCVYRLTSYADDLIGTYTVNYRRNTAGCPPSNPAIGIIHRHKEIHTVAWAAQDHSTLMPNLAITG